MDDADRATENEEAAWADLERRIAAARECQTRPSRSTFMVRHPGEWFPGRCDRFWLVDILAGKVG